MAYDAVVIGAGPNGLAAGIELARAGYSVLLREGGATVGGSVRSAELTLPGFVHDVCSTVMAMVPLSPFMQSLPLADHGVEFVEPAIAFAHPFDDGSAAWGEKSVIASSRSVGEIDAPAYQDVMGKIVEAWDRLAPVLLAPPRLPEHWWKDAGVLAEFGLKGLRSAEGFSQHEFRGAAARGLFAGAAAHAVLPPTWKGTAAFGLILTAAAHIGGWPFVRGGAQRLSDGLASIFRSMGGTIETGQMVGSLEELPPCRAVLCDVTPRQLIRIAGERLASGYRRRLERFEYGPGAFKVDYALSGPIPWTAEACRRAGTLHLGGTMEEISRAERAPWDGQVAERPYVLVAQPTVFDSTRAPAGKHIAWSYCHVPNGCTIDMTERIEAQIERYAPGFRDLVLARSVRSPADLEAYNPNLVGGDVNAGAQYLKQLFGRPVFKMNPYEAGAEGLYLCSASTPPGGGVHGLCGFFAAETAKMFLERGANGGWGK